jgi:hypothetical protein
VLVGAAGGEVDLPVFVTADMLLVEFHRIFGEALARHEKGRDARRLEALRFLAKELPRATRRWTLPEKTVAAAAKRAKAEIEKALAKPALLASRTFRIDDDGEFLAFLVLRRALYGSRDREGRRRVKAILREPAVLFGRGADPALATGPTRWIYPFDAKALETVRAAWREESKIARLLPAGRPPDEVLLSKTTLKGDSPDGLHVATALGSGYARGFLTNLTVMAIDRERSCFGAEGLYGDYYRCLGATLQGTEKGGAWPAKRCRTVVAAWRWMRTRKPIAGETRKVRVGAVEQIPLFLERLAALADRAGEALPDERWKGFAARVRGVEVGEEIELLTGVEGMRRLYVLSPKGEEEVLGVGFALPFPVKPVPDWLDALELPLAAEGAVK